MRRHIFTIRWSWARILRNLSEVCLSKKDVLTICVLSAIKVFPKKMLKKIDCPTLVVHWRPLWTIFLPQDIFKAKNLSYQKIKKMDQPLVREAETSVSTRPPVLNMSISTNIWLFFQTLLSILCLQPRCRPWWWRQGCCLQLWPCRLLRQRWNEMCW